MPHMQSDQGGACGPGEEGWVWTDQKKMQVLRFAALTGRLRVWGQAGSIMAVEDVHVLIPQTCKYVTC